jgi:hypothetical protein
MAPRPASSRVDDFRIGARYAVGLPRFLRRRITEADANRRIRLQLADRERSFLDVFRRGMLECEASPYQALLRNAGVEYGDVAGVVRRDGLERALEQLCEAGVYLTLEEFKGVQPIRRSGLELPTKADDFDNPLAPAVLTRLSSGSRGPRRSIRTNFEHFEHEAAYIALFVAAFDLAGRPAAIWRPVPPSTAGLNAVLYSAKLGEPVQRWFSQNRLQPGRGETRDFLLTKYTVLASRLCGVPIPAPEHVPLTEAVRVAGWLADKRAAGTPAWLNAPASSGVRVCLAAHEHGLDISGTLFRFGGEPLTQAKADAVAATGSRAVSFYAMSEIGRIGLACAAPVALDEVHLVSDSLALIQRERPVGGDGAHVGVLLHTTLTPSARKLMLNVESGDYGVLVDRDCGCPVGDVGLTRHLHTIRSYEKLTTEGMTFLGTELLTLVEEVLPSRFGGRPIDYQLIEEEDARGLTRVSLVVSPGVGALDEAALLQATHEVLAAGPSYRSMMAGIWREGETLRVVRREPYATPAGKLLPLHILKPRRLGR